MTGNISKHEYTRCIKHMIELSKKMTDSWEMMQHSEDYYLRKKCMKPCSIIEDNSSCIEGDISLNETVRNEENAVITNENMSKVLTFEYHVLYSESYSVPVLYFNVYKSDGGLLPLERVWALVPQSYRDRLEQDKWTFLTQTEHPYLGRPFYQLHPCHTENLISSLKSVDVPETKSVDKFPETKSVDKFPETDPSNVLIGFLSIVGPIVLLDMPMEYGKANGRR